MFIDKIVLLFQPVEAYLRKYFALIFCLGVLLIAGGMTFKLQNKIVGWEPGYEDLQPKHHGWVSSQGLAIIASATPANRFVGFAIEYKDEQNNIQYDYFDRYPVFFSAIFSQVLALGPTLSAKMYLAKQVMNLIFLATLFVAFLLIDKLIQNKPLALAVVLLTFSNPFLLFFKDMVHFDQPALFGFLLLTYTIAIYKLDGVKWPLVIATFVAIALGRGYASYGVLIVWLAIEAWLILRPRGMRFGQKLVGILKHPAFYMLAIGILWGAGLLSYNILVEAQKRNIPILETSILHSAGQRLSLNEEFNQQYANIVNWGDFIQGQINRIIKWSFPVNKVDLGLVGNGLLLIGMFAVMGRMLRGQILEKRIIFLVMMFSGFAWLLPLKNLAAFHDYTTMYYIGIPLVFICSIIWFLKPSREFELLSGAGDISGLSVGHLPAHPLARGARR